VDLTLCHVMTAMDGFRLEHGGFSWAKKGHHCRHTEKCDCPYRPYRQSGFSLASTTSDGGAPDGGWRRQNFGMAAAIVSGLRTCCG
jgi:hypothetical protein